MKVSEDNKIPEGLIQVGTIVEGGGINVDAFIAEEERKGFTCIRCDGYVMVCRKGKKR